MDDSMWHKAEGENKEKRKNGDEADAALSGSTSQGNLPYV
jgi:hypothetical protein